MAVSVERAGRHGQEEQRTGLDGTEVAIIDMLLGARTPIARTGDPVACDQVIRLLDLRLRYTRQKKQTTAW